MIEQILLDYLSGKMRVPVLAEEPEEPPEKYVLVEKTGSAEEDHIQSAIVVLQSYAGSLYEAALLNQSVKTAMSDLPELDDICSCKLNSDYNFTDTQTKRYRYQAVYDITHY